MKLRATPSLDWLLVFVPAAILLEFVAPERHTIVFGCACLAVIPLAGWMGKSTEHIAGKAGAGVGGLLNATFGNAAELIIALMALHRGLINVVKASLTGSIIGNLLLVLGGALLAGGVKFESQKFNKTGARAQSTTLLLAAIALVMPAAFHHLAVSGNATAREADLSFEISMVLLVTYGLSLLFSLRTHAALFTGPQDSGGAGEWTLRRSLCVLGVATVLIAWISEILVGSVEGAAKALGMSDIFVGVIVVAIVGNAAEHSTAILAARKNQMDLSLGIAIGSTIQVALFVAPVLVLASYALAPRPMDLVFSTAEVLAVVLSVVIVAHIAGDGESNWLEGAQLLAVYALLVFVFYLLPVPALRR